MNSDPLPHGFQSGAASLRSHSFKGHLSTWCLFSICSCPLLIKPKMRLSGLPSEGRGTQLTGTGRLCKLPPALFSGCLQTQASPCLSTYSWRVISFPWPQEIDWKTHLWVLEQNKAAEKMCCQMVLPLRPPLVCVQGSVFSLAPQGCN